MLLIIIFVQQFDTVENVDVLVGLDCSKLTLSPEARVRREISLELPFTFWITTRSTFDLLVEI